jgi:peptidoglycan/LPS O-acetylase OafA/YrhL
MCASREEFGMRFRILAVASVVLVILGVSSLGVTLQDLNAGIEGDTYLGFTMAACFLAGGVSLYVAARRRYWAGWRIYVGSFLAFFGFVGASVEADDVANLRAEDPILGFMLACVFVTSGYLLARSGYVRGTRRERRSAANAGPATSYAAPQVHTKS